MDGLDGVGFETRCKKHFPHCPERTWRPPRHLHNGCRVFSEGRTIGTWR